MRFYFKAINKEGEVYSGEQDAKDKFALYSDIKADGGTVISVENKPKRKSFKDISVIFSTVSLKEKINFARSFGSMIEAGLSVSRALSVLQQQTKNDKFKTVIKKISIDISKGNSVNQALEVHPKIFPPLFVAMVKAGEESGSIPNALKIVADQLERTYQLKKKVQGAMIYPTIVIAIMIIIGILMMIYVVPTLTETFEELEAELPYSTQFIIAVSVLLTDYILISMATLLTFALATIYFLKTVVGKKVSSFILLKTPVIGGILIEVNSARTTRTLSSLLSSGVEVVSALSITKDVLQNPYYKDVMQDAILKVQKGVPLSAIFSEHQDIYPVLVTEMVSVGEETGKLTEMFLKVAEFYEDEVDQKTKNISTIIEPILMVFIGIAVGFFALSMISPIYSLSSSI